MLALAFAAEAGVAGMLTLGGIDNLAAAIQREYERRDASWAEEVRVLREALTEIAEREIDWREGPGKNVAWLQEIAEKAIEQADRIAGRRGK